MKAQARLLPLILLPLLAACGEDVAYRPAAQILPANIKRVSIRLAVNKTQQFGIEDRLTLRTRDEFLRDGRYPILPEANSDGIVQMTITRYILSPVQYDPNLVPTAYKLRILVDLQFIDRATNTALWKEPNMEGILTYPAATLPGGKTEEQARDSIYDVLARDVVKRVIDGFGSVSGSSQRIISGDAPSTPPSIQPAQPQKPVNTNVY
jgi:hypothetical protein